MAESLWLSADSCAELLDLRNRRFWNAMPAGRVPGTGLGRCGIVPEIGNEEPYTRRAGAVSWGV